MTQSHTRIQGRFYALTSAELLYLCQILTDAEIKTLLYLKSIHPFTDTYKELDTAAIAEQLNLHTRSIRRFLKKFKELNLIDWEITKFKYKPLSNSKRIVRSQNGSQDHKTDPTIHQRIVGSQNGSQDHFQLSEPLPDKTSSSLQTIQTIQNLQTAGGKEKTQSEPASLEDHSTETTSSDPSDKLTDLSSILTNNLLVNTKANPEERTSPDCHTNDTEILTNSTNNIAQNFSLSPSSSLPVPKSSIPSDILTKLEDLGIPLDDAVRRIISTHHPSQVWGALRHIEETSDEIRSPRGVFLYQVPKQPKDNRKLPHERITDEFKHWYQQAIVDGLVVNRPIESLGLYQFREPIVQLPDGTQWPWTQVRDGKAEIQKKMTFEEGSFLNPQKLKEIAQKAAEQRLQSYDIHK